MREACKEAQVLRSLLPDSHARTRALDKLVRRYAEGRRTAEHVVQALNALCAQNRICSPTVLEAFHAVQPIPTVLWTWACAHHAQLHVDALSFMLRQAAQNRTYQKHLRRVKHALADTPDGMVAVFHEGHRLGWAAVPV